MKTRSFYLMFYGGTFHFIIEKWGQWERSNDEGRWKLREVENHHQINSFEIVPRYTFLYTRWPFIAFQQMVYFLFFFTSAKCHTLFSFNKLSKSFLFSAWIYCFFARELPRKVVRWGALEKVYQTFSGKFPI